MYLGNNSDIQRYGDSCHVFNEKEITEFPILAFLQKSLLIIWVKKSPKKNPWRTQLYNS